MTSIWWIRRDLRLSDQPALRAAAAAGPVVPLFVLDPHLLKISQRRTDFLLGNLRSLDADLRSRGASLVVRTGNAEQVLPQVLAEAGADAVYVEEDYTPYARRRDAAVGLVCDLRLLPGQCVHHPGEVQKADGSPYVVYSPYSRAWKKRLPERLMPLAAPGHIDMAAGVGTEDLPPVATPIEFLPGEAEAHRRLQAFVDHRIFEYSQCRDRMDLDGTSALSPYIHFGVLSMRTAVAAALSSQLSASSEEARQGAESWLNELIWREFYIQILHHFPRVGQGPFRAEYSAVEWRNRPDEFERWKQGQTGVPVVDAGMRQLRLTGWMHNRARMIAASYLVKDLLIDWRWGEGWFMQQLVDGDLGANNGGWQWTAGTGTDAAPYFRIFNPVLQGKRYDPQGDYVRRWVPELRDMPANAIHEPWASGSAGHGYPKEPMADHSAAVRRTRLAYETARERFRRKGIL